MSDAHLTSSVFELIERINKTTTIATAWQTYMSAAQTMGLTYGLACFLPDDKSIGGTLFAQSLPPGWLENYLSKGYQDCDPLVRICRESIAPVSWSITDWDGLLTGTQIGWRDDNMSFGLCRGVVIPDRRDGVLKAISLSGNPDAIDPADQKALYFSGLEMLTRMHDLGLHVAGAPSLAPRERECLRWMAAGKSDWEIGQILSISEKTVATHIERVKQKLGVATRAQVIVASMGFGLLTP